MKRNRLLATENFLSDSLNNSNVVNVDDSEENKENVAKKGLVLVGLTRTAAIIDKSSLTSAIKNNKVIPSNTNIKRRSNKAASQNTSDNTDLFKLSVGDLIIPKKSINKNKTETLKIGELHVTDDCIIINNLPLAVSENINEIPTFKTPKRLLHGKRSLPEKKNSMSSLISSTMASPILASSPIIAVKLRRNKSKKNDFGSTSIVASSDTPASYHTSKNQKLSISDAFISPIKTNKSPPKTDPGPLRRTRSNCGNLHLPNLESQL